MTDEMLQLCSEYATAFVETLRSKGASPRAIASVTCQVMIREGRKGGMSDTDLLDCVEVAMTIMNQDGRLV